MATSEELRVLVSVPALARKLHLHPNGLRRRLVKLHSIDRTEGRPEWLFVVPGEGRRRHLRVNESALYAAHSELQRARAEKPVDAESVLARVGDVEKSSRDFKKFVRRQFLSVFSRIEALESTKT